MFTNTTLKTMSVVFFLTVGYCPYGRLALSAIIRKEARILSNFGKKSATRDTNRDEFSGLTCVFIAWYDKPHF